MSVAQIVRTLGDRDNQFHRSALSGNAMQFTATRWVRLTSGADQTPAWSTNQANTFIIVYRSVANSTGVDSRTVARTILSNGSFFDRQMAGNLINTGYRFVIGGDFYDKFGIDNIVTDFQRSQNSPAAFVQPKRQFYIWQDPGGLNTNNKSCNYHGRNMAQSVLLSNLTLQNRAAGDPIGIGRYPSQNNDPNQLYPFTNTFEGWIRSIEIIVGRNLTNEQVRRTFNYGTAHAAGLITTNDISIDFNRLNGQLPICRAGSRQLTVTAYNNTTPDTAGTTYADFYTL